LVAVAGVVISMSYYFGVIRALYWPSDTAETAPIRIPPAMKISLAVCMVGMLWLGLFPNALVQAAAEAVKALRF
jgi:NADH:ubiquinone oxidoreductase subunit 2 (subunit N)